MITGWTLLKRTQSRVNLIQPNLFNSSHTLCACDGCSARYQVSRPLIGWWALAWPLIGWPEHNSGHNQLLCSHFWSCWESLSWCCQWCYCCCRSRLKSVCHFNCFSSSLIDILSETSKSLNPDILRSSQSQSSKVTVSLLLQCQHTPEI